MLWSATDTTLGQLSAPSYGFVGKQNWGTALTTAPGHFGPYNIKSACLNARYCNQKKLAFTQTSDTSLNTWPLLLAHAPISVVNNRKRY